MSNDQVKCLQGNILIQVLVSRSWNEWMHVEKKVADSLQQKVKLHNKTRKWFLLFW